LVYGLLMNQNKPQKTKQKTKQKGFSLIMPVSLVEQVDEIATKERRSRNQTILLMVEDALRARNEIGGMNGND